MLSTVINCAGLVVDITGAALVFFNSPPVSYTTYLFNKEEGQQMQKKANKRNTNAKYGFVLLALGFILQLIGNIITLA